MTRWSCGVHGHQIVSCCREARPNEREPSGAIEGRDFRIRPSCLRCAGTGTTYSALDGHGDPGFPCICAAGARALDVAIDEAKDRLASLERERDRREAKP